MKPLFINLSNHPSNLWSQEQLIQAKPFGEIVDIPFPVVDEMASSDSISALADEYFQKIRQLSDNTPCTVHLMGEMTFTFALVTRLLNAGYHCIASTTRRDVVLLPDGTKQAAFHFCRFREY